MLGAANRPTSVTSPRRPWLAAVLSFVFPGLGQAYVGRPIPGVILAAPPAVLALTAIVLLNGAGGPLRNLLLSSGFLVAMIGLNVALFAWRAYAIADAGLSRPLRGAGERRSALATTSILVLLTLVMHVWVGVVVAHLDDALRRVFDGVAVPAEPMAPPGEGGGSADPEPEGSPSTSFDPEPRPRWDGTERINVLLLGTDALETRNAVLTDVILVVSIDPVSESAVMISVPRDTGFVPLPDTSVHADRRYPGKINSLMAAARGAPERWCPDLPENADPDACGLRTIERGIGLYLGIEIHHYARIDMAGFAEMVDALGGLRLCLPGELHDPEFDGSLDSGSETELVLPAGCHEYGGLDALAYARSRQGWIEMPDGTREPQTDFSRIERQQALLLALRDELADSDLIFELPGVLGSIARAVTTDVPRDQAGDLASLLPFIARPDIERVVLDHPRFVELPAQPRVNYLLIPRRDAIRAEMERIFGRDALEGWYLTSDRTEPPARP